MAETCIIFDCDGVLVDSELIAARVAAACFTEAGASIDAAEMLDRFAGVAAATVTKTIFAERGLPVPANATELRRAAIMTAFETELRATDGADEALSRIHAAKCVASSSHPDRIAQSLRLTGLDRHFGDAIFSVLSVPQGKPAPDLFLYAARAMNAEPVHCIVVEDSVAGVRAGKAAGMAVIGFVGGSHCRPDHHRRLLDAGADRIARHMSELPEIIVFERATRRF
ncbi:MAG: HAD family hydrolase [Bauldia sp.]